MLSRKVCKACRYFAPNKLIQKNFSWVWTGELPCSLKQYEAKIKELPPEDCPLKLEHTLALTGFVEKAKMLFAAWLQPVVTSIGIGLFASLILLLILVDMMQSYDDKKEKCEKVSQQETVKFLRREVHRLKEKLKNAEQENLQTMYSRNRESVDSPHEFGVEWR